MDHSHRRTGSAMAAYTSQSITQGMTCQRGISGVCAAGKPYQHSMEARKAADTAHNRKAISRKPVGSSYAGREPDRLHARSQSCATHQSNNDRDCWQDKDRITNSATGQGQHSELPPQNRIQYHQKLSVSKHDSQSSISSSTTASTPPADRMCSWSSSTTPVSMSPTSPRCNPILHSLPERTSSKSHLPESDYSKPSWTVGAGSLICRSTSQRFHNTPIESTVLEEDECQEGHGIYSGRSSNRASSNTILAVNQIIQDYTALSNLHQRRQERQEKISTYLPFPQPPRTKLSPLSPLPLQQLPSGASLAKHRGLNREASRSLPQLRGHPSPPPTGPLPPLPSVPHISPMFPPTPRTPTAPTTPATVTPTLVASHPPPPAIPPPPPPRSVTALPAEPVIRKENTPRIPMNIPKSMDAELSRKLQEHQRREAQKWEEQLQHHKQHLQQFTPQLDRQKQWHNERPKLSRTYRSLGNLRARSRAQSTPLACDDIFTTSSIVRSPTIALPRPKTAKSSKMKSIWNSTGRLEQPLPPLPRKDDIHISVFEEDSDDEGDAVRRFVRNLFTRRVRSGGDIHTNSTFEKRPASSASKDSSIQAGPGNHNSRGDNRSVSSSFSTATTVETSAAVSASTTITTTSSEAGSSSEADCHQATDGSSQSTDQARQRGPLITRMFVRRSH